MEIREPLRDQVGRALYEEPGKNLDWYMLSEERREPWRLDADRIIPLIHNEYSAVQAERDRAHRACEQLGTRIYELERRFEEHKLDTVWLSKPGVDHAPEFIVEGPNVRAVVHKKLLEMRDRATRQPISYKPLFVEAIDLAADLLHELCEIDSGMESRHLRDQRPGTEDTLSQPAWCAWCGGTCKCEDDTP